MVVEKVKLGKKEVVLIGTAHISKNSVDLVRKTIEKEKPDVVAVELCAQRYETLKNKDKWKETKISEVIKQGKAYLFLANLILANFQKKLGEMLGIEPGSEMLVAIDSAIKVGSKVAFVDRNIQVTLRRALSLMTFKEKIKILVSLLMDTFGAEIDEELIEKLKEKDVLSEVMKELSTVVPSVKRVLIDERDLYIANKLQEIEGKKIVAVVGIGHLAGIKKNLSVKKSKVDMKALESVPTKRFKVKYLGYIVPIIFAILLGYGFYAKGAGATIEMLWMWFLINGLLAAVGTALAFGHPLSVLTAFVAAPFTSLNPALAAGWFAGYVEAKVRNPKVKDFENLNKLSGIKEYWKNQITRILLVVVFANIGSSIGTFVALPYLLSLL